MITLDDESVAPIGHRRRTTMVTRTAFAIGKVWTTLSGRGNEAIGKMIKFFGACAGGFLGLRIVTANGSLSHRLYVAVNSTAFLTRTFQVTLGTALVLFLILLLRFVAVIVGLATIPTSIIIASAGRQVLQTETRQHLQISSQKSIDACVKYIRTFSRRALMVRMLVLKTDSSVWKQTVGSVLLECDLVLVDVSEITENVLWELELLTLGVVPVVAVCSASELQRLLNGPRSGLENRAMSLLGDSLLLPYTNDELGRQKFVNELRDRFDLTKKAKPNAKCIEKSRKSMKVEWRSRRRRSNR